MNTDLTKKLLFILPHPDDESFVPGGTIAKYGHTAGVEVSLYTLTKGESSRNAAYLGITPAEMGTRRAGEVQQAARILGVHRHIQGSYPDAGLRDLDPRILEEDLEGIIREITPDCIVTYDIQGASGHPDHIVAHCAVKRCFVLLREQLPGLRRLVFMSVHDEMTKSIPRKIFGLLPERIDAVIHVEPWLEIKRQAIDVQVSVRRDVEEQNWNNWMMSPREYFSFFQESFSPPVDDLFFGL